MAELTALERSDPIVAEKVLRLLFDESTSAAKQWNLEFLSAVIEHMSQHHSDRWGVTKLVCQVLDRTTPNTTIASSVKATLPAHFDEIVDPQPFSEGDRIRVCVNRVDGDYRAREACRPSYGSGC